MAASERQDSLQISAAVIFAAGGLRRRKLQIRIAHQLVEQRRNTAALRSKLRVPVEAQAAAREVRDERINEHVRRARIESKDLLRLCRARKHRDVGNAAEVEGNTTELFVAVQER